ncbi:MULTISPECIES: preprotein translocase subunit SecD [Halomicrobium]|uniref:Protein-export membrane protein SecD n=2 Tax=Halomicrobium mukohataei TaxID=57705 RepID=C7P2X1_HALMD|nr:MULTISPECIES: preprotein translocase subunit SecD [Halomicrobium]ACV47443.1 SecD/SecF/SecDF export membrane protein [Halomicrobium mukohataei DSM 12286]QCD65907.1 preprotein translocase subunit SecD [Halomicrobium mukohataei]QFR20712.1 MMPL family transporter [Halomicrobium sp. ZPS1]
MSGLRDNWRIILLVVLALGSTVTLLVPGATVATGDNATAQTDGANASAAGITNLQYGIQLDGGSRIRAPIVGITAENVDIQPVGRGDETNETIAIEDELVSQLGVDPVDVNARAPNEPNADGTVEVYTENVTQAELAAALQEQGYDVSESDVRDGVTRATRDEMVEVIDEKLSQSALSGGSVQSAQSATGQNFVVIEAPGRDIDELRSIVANRGIVRVYGGYAADNGTFVRQQIVSREDIDGIGNARKVDGRQGYRVSVTIREDAVDQFLDGVRATGLDEPNTARGAISCEYNAENPNQSSGKCLIASLNNEVVTAKGVSPGLVQLFADGSFANDPTFVIETNTREEARNIELSLKAGQPLPAPLDFQNAQTTSLEPALADQFKTNSLITGIIAVLAVSIAVYLRYGDPRVAVPMIVTALSEVLLLLGFVSAIQFPLDLSHIAGFIAVIGTGVDDLIIIADEILQREGVATGRVFQNRFRKAFWVIGAAAATTIIAMSPLTVLGLGDLTGFAIITIVGVLIGVLITRPAYGDILRRLVLDEEERSE